MRFISGLINLITVSVTLAITMELIEWDYFAILILFYIPLPTILALAGTTFLNPLKKIHFVVRLPVIMLTAAILSFGMIWCESFVMGIWLGDDGYLLYIAIIASIFQLVFLDRFPQRPTDNSQPENN